MLKWGRHSSDGCITQIVLMMNYEFPGFPQHSCRIFLPGLAVVPRFIPRCQFDYIYFIFPGCPLFGIFLGQKPSETHSQYRQYPSTPNTLQQNWSTPCHVALPTSDRPQQQRAWRLSSGSPTFVPLNYNNYWNPNKKMSNSESSVSVIIGWLLDEVCGIL